MKVLADASALVALFVPNDRNHLAAANFFRADPRTRYVVTELVLAEVVTFLRAHGSAPRAAAVGREIAKSERYGLLFVDTELLQGALDQLERFADKRLSLTDCVSFEVMERLGIEAAFAFDRDFRDCGFRMVP